MGRSSQQILGSNKLAPTKRLPQNLRILTWNYDTQWEKAFYGFCEDKEWTKNIVTHGTSIYRINGFCGIYPFEYITKIPLENRAWEIGISLYQEYSSNPPIAE